MRIIREGALAAEQLYTCTCLGCRTEYEFARKEARFSSGGQREGDSLITKCPLPGCGRENWTAVRTGGSQWDR